MINKALLTLSILLITTILNAQDFTIGIDPGFKLPGLTREEAWQQIRLAADDITKVANVNFISAHYPYIRVNSKSFHKDLLGWWSGQEALLNNEHTWDKDKLRGVATHEILHALGLQHDDHPESIMKAKYDNTLKLGPTDIEKLVKRYGKRK